MVLFQQAIIHGLSTQTCTAKYILQTNSYRLYIDQPFGTGFSYTKDNKYAQSIPELSDSFLKFMLSFYEIFPQYKKAELYLSGESYAGIYIPYIAKAIVDYNAKGGYQMKLKGMLIGNGWIDSMRQVFN